MDAGAGLVCGVCKKLMRNPQILPCDHSFCKHPCLLKHPNSTTASCIYCLIEVHVSQLQPNHKLAARIRDAQRTQSRREVCPLCNGVCEKRIHCEHCRLQVCATCRNQHMDIVRKLEACPSCGVLVQERTPCLHCDRHICNLCVQKHFENMRVILRNKIESIKRKRDQLGVLQEDLTSKKTAGMKTIAELTGAIDVASEELQSACARALSATEVSLDKMESKVDDQLTSKAKEYTDLGASMKGLELRRDDISDSKDMNELVDFKKSATLVIEQLGDKTSLDDNAVGIFENLSVSRCFTTIGSQLEDFSLLAVKGLPVTGDGHYPAAIKRFFSHRELKDIHRTPSIDSQELPTISTVKIYVGDLPEKTTNDDLLEYFRQFGTVDDPYVAKDFKTGKSLNYGFVTFSDPQCVDKVLNTAPHFLKGSRIYVRRFKAPSQREASTAPTSQELPTISTVKIHVCDLPEKTTKDDLLEYFKQFGTVDDPYVAKDFKTGKSLSYGFVTFSDPQSVDKVLNAAPHFLKGSNIHVRRFKAPSQREASTAPT
ncbi:hypothetical protein SprV_0200955200 [Sparganum proliferum]